VTIDQVLQLLEIGISVTTMAGGAFALGRVFERIERTQKDVSEIKGALFGTDAKEGVFLPRAEAKLMFQSAMQREDLDRRFDLINNRLNVIDGRAPPD
jgi:hypothetical protein